MKTTVRFDNVSKRYDLGLTRTSLPSVISNWVKSSLRRLPPEDENKRSLWALKDVSFELKQGESLALVGSNGAGKTTALKLLANITKPTSGNIEINGNLSALIELGAGFHPDLSGRENIFLNGTILGLSRKYLEQRFDDIVAFSELDRFIDTPVKRYSSGMTVRLGFAVAASIEPEILLIDEVLAVGDASFRQKCMNRIQQLLDNGTSIIFVSHNFWLVQAVCSRALYLEKGQVKHEGETTKILELYDRDLSENRARKFEHASSDQDIASEKLEISAIEIVDSISQSADKLRNDQSAEIRVHYNAYQHFGEAQVVIRVLRSDGITCFMIRSSLDQVPVSFPRGKGILKLTLNPLQLYGGTYYVQVIFRDKKDTFHIAQAMSDWFYVAGGAQSHHEMNGVYEPNRRWEQHQETMMTVNDHQPTDGIMLSN